MKKKLFFLCALFIGVMFSAQAQFPFSNYLQFYKLNGTNDAMILHKGSVTATPTANVTKLNDFWNGKTALTIEFWFNFGGNPTGQQHFISLGDEVKLWQTPKRRWYLIVHGVNMGLVEGIGATDGLCIPLNEWHHYAFVYDASSGTAISHCYMDGVMLEEYQWALDYKTNATPNKTYIFYDPNPSALADITAYPKVLTLANAQNWPIAAANNYDYQVADIRVWDVALTRSQISGWMGKYVEYTHPKFANLRNEFSMTDKIDNASTLILPDRGNLAVNAEVLGTDPLKFPVFFAEPTLVSGIKTQPKVQYSIAMVGNDILIGSPNSGKQLIMIFDATGKEFSRTSVIFNNNKATIKAPVTKGIYVVTIGSSSKKLAVE